jgi:steroid delta-isomerase-like uncharacterized protein
VGLVAAEMTPAERQALVRRHLESENAHRLEATLETLTADCVFEDMALHMRVTGQQAAADYYQRWWNGFSDLTWVPQRRGFTEDGVVAELIVRGRHDGEYLGIPPTGRTIELPVAILVSFADGLMASERLYYDLATLLRQLGVSTVPATGGEAGSASVRG